MERHELRAGVAITNFHESEITAKLASRAATIQVPNEGRSLRELWSRNTRKKAGKV